jgi:thiamine transport system substrate-binding protein
MNGPSIPASPSPRRRRAGANWRTFVAISVAVVVAVAGYAAYGLYLHSPSHSGKTLNIYTYPSLFSGGSCQSPVFDSVFGEFGRVHGVSVQVTCPPGNLASTLLQQKNSPGADVVIGLDEITAPEADHYGLLVPYLSPQLANVPPRIIAEISPDHAVTPYESGFLSIDYNASFASATHGAVGRSSFFNFSQNLSWAKQLMIEDPTADITGGEFLAWQIEFYQTVLHQDWTTFWNAADGSLRVAPDWSTAFATFAAGGPSAPSMVVSYLTDAAYAAYSNNSGAYNATVSSWNGTSYGWRTVYGIGIVRGSTNVALDQAFIDWFLSGAVQSQIPTNEWEIPANSTIPLPSVYAAMPNASSIVPLNDRTTPNATAQNLPGWLTTWQTIANLHG